MKELCIQLYIFIKKLAGHMQSPLKTRARILIIEEKKKRKKTG
jgi:hypothetical protein